MIEASAPELPDTPTAEQIAAWLELEEIMQGPVVRRLQEEERRGHVLPRASIRTASSGKPVVRA